MIIGVALKQPWEELDWDVDCRAAFNLGTDTVESVEIIVTPDDPEGLTSDAVVMDDGDAVKVWFRGGVHETEYLAEVRVTTAKGRHKEDEILVRVEERK